MKLVVFNFLLAVVIIIVTLGCAGSQKKTAPQEQSSFIATINVVNTENKGCYGTYEGILPCAGCGVSKLH